ncbi:MAG: transcriptional repressor [Desulfobacterales bacterium]
MRLTRQRKVIISQLRKLTSHPSADEIYEIVRKNLPRISLGTVYRNLETLVEMGEIQRLEWGGSVRRFDGNAENHYHVRCITCDKVIDAPLENMDHLESMVQKNTDFQVLGHRMEFLGICPECSAKQNKNGQ